MADNFFLLVHLWIERVLLQELHACAFRKMARCARLQVVALGQGPYSVALTDPVIWHAWHEEFPCLKHHQSALEQNGQEQMFRH